MIKIHKDVKKALIGVGSIWLHILGVIFLLGLLLGLCRLAVYCLITHPYVTVISGITFVGAINGLCE